MQLGKRIPDAEPDHDAILMQVQMFKQSMKKCLEKLESKKGDKDSRKPEEVSVPKLFEEIKVMFQDLPARIERRVSERPPRSRRLGSMMLMDIMHFLERDREDPVGILVVSSIFRDEIPWLYDIGIETYRAVKSGDAKRTEVALREFRKIVELTARGPMLEYLEISPDTIMLLEETLNRFSRRYRMPAEHLLKAEERHEITQELPANLLVQKVISTNI